MSQLNLDYIRENIVAAIGSDSYIRHIDWICDILDDLHAESFPEGPGIDDLTVKFVVDKIQGNRQSTGKKDLLDMLDPSDQIRAISLDEMAERHSESFGTQNIKQVNDFVSIGPAKKKQHIVNVANRIERLVEILNMLKENPKLKLTDIKVGEGKETANDWISDLKRKTIDGQTEYITKLIKDIYDISKKNFTKGTATDLIRRTVTKQQLKTLTSKEICRLCNLEYNGSHRKMINRLQKGQA